MFKFCTGVIFGVAVCFDAMYFCDGDIGKPSTFIVIAMNTMALVDCLITIFKD